MLARLARAREKIPRGEFNEADLEDLPLANDSVDLVGYAIALVHLAEIDRPFREFARVLRPGGHLVVCDQRGFFGEIIPPVVRVGPDGEVVGYIPAYGHLTSDYLAAALPIGIPGAQVRGAARAVAASRRRGSDDPRRRAAAGARPERTAE